MESPDFSSLQHSMDRYLDQHGHSNEAYVKVTDVLNKWEFMIGLATRRAMGELYFDQLPDNVIPFQRPLVAPTDAS